MLSSSRSPPLLGVVGNEAASLESFCLRHLTENRCHPCEGRPRHRSIEAEEGNDYLLTHPC
jgi:hypothetical protein